MPPLFHQKHRLRKHLSFCLHAGDVHARWQGIGFEAGGVASGLQGQIDKQGYAPAEHVVHLKPHMCGVVQLKRDGGGGVERIRIIPAQHGGLWQLGLRSGVHIYKISKLIAEMVAVVDQI